MNNLEVQPINPITNPVEMDSKLVDVVAKLNGNARYRQLFFNAFEDSVVTSQHMLKALAQFMLHLSLVDEGLAPSAAVGAVQRWMIDPARAVPPDLPTALAATATAADLTRPDLWAMLTYRGC